MKVEEYSHFNIDPMLEPVWRNLLNLSDVDSIFGSYQWAREWWSAFKQKNDKLCLTLISEGNQAHGLAALYLTQERWGALKANVLAPVGQNTAQYLDFILPVEPQKTVSRLFDFLVEKPGWDVLSLNNMPKSSVNFKYIKSTASARKLMVVEEPEDVCPFILLEDNYNTFMLKRFRSKFRKEIKRNTRRLQAKGHHHFEMIYKAKNLHRVFSEIVRLENHSWKGKKKLGIFSTPSKQRFYYQIMQILAANGKLVVLLQWLDNKLITYEIAFLSKNRFLAFNTAFDSDFRIYAPGVLSQVELIKQCFKMNIPIFDFLRGGEHYKSKWTDVATQNVNLHIFAPTNRGSVLSGGLKGRMLLRKLKRRIRPRRDVADFKIINSS